MSKMLCLSISNILSLELVKYWIYLILLCIFISNILSLELVKDWIYLSPLIY